VCTKEKERQREYERERKVQSARALELHDVAFLTSP